MLLSTSVLRQYLLSNMADFRRGMEALPRTLDVTLLLKLQKQVGMQLKGIRSLQLIHMVSEYWCLRFSMGISSLRIKSAK